MKLPGDAGPACSRLLAASHWPSIGHTRAPAPEAGSSWPRSLRFPAPGGGQPPTRALTLAQDCRAHAAVFWIPFLLEFEQGQLADCRYTALSVLCRAARTELANTGAPEMSLSVTHGGKGVQSLSGGRLCGPLGCAERVSSEAGAFERQEGESAALPSTATAGTAPPPSLPAPSSLLAKLGSQGHEGGHPTARLAPRLVRRPPR